MTLLDRYIVRSILQASAVVGLAVAALVVVTTFIGEADNLGEGRYGIWAMLQYLALMLPKDLYLVFPVVALLGALTALGALAAGGELVVMRASGISALRLGWAVLIAGVLLAAAAVVLGEMLGPVGAQTADELRDRARHGQQVQSVGGGLWLRDGNRQVRIGGMLSEDRVVDVLIYRLTDDGRLAAVIRAPSAVVGDGWRLRQAELTRFTPDSVHVDRREEMRVPIKLPPYLLRLSVTKPNELTTLGLYRYIDYLEANGVAAGEYRLAFWRSLVTPVTVVVLTLFALPFAFGSLRSAGAGQRLFVGGLVGLVFFMLNEITAASGQVMGLPPWFAAALPTAILLMISLYWLRRIS